MSEGLIVLPNEHFRELFASAAVHAAMRFHIALILLGTGILGCSTSPIRSTAHAIVPKTPAPHTAIASIETEVQRTPRIDSSCPLFFPPHDIGSVIHIPATIMARAMSPTMVALCSCTKPGEYATIVARIDFGAGTVDVAARDNSAINECLTRVPVTFTPVPEDELPGSDCINCGPKYYGVFAESPPPPKKEGIRLMYSFALDRSGEVLDCPSETHAERGECRSNERPVVESKKQSCACAPTDLDCAIACAGSK